MNEKLQMNYKFITIGQMITKIREFMRRLLKMGKLKMEKKGLVDQVLLIRSEDL
jgi:hypothetical protein